MSHASDRAIVGVCLDTRQRRILQVTLPTWRRYAERCDLPLIILERDLADGDFYWNKHRLFRAPELKRFRGLLFLDNDVFISPHARPLLNDWESPLLGATFESTQSGMSANAIARYYDDYFVERVAADTHFQIINTGVLVIPREQAEFLEETYSRWKKRGPTSRPDARLKDRFTLVADQPHVSYALQAQKRFQDIGEKFNTLWWKWYDRRFPKSYRSFLVRSKTAALTSSLLPRPIWRALFRNERALFSAARADCDFLHVAGSKSAAFLGS
jgi:hypothetical protein